ncbi:NmrA family transcriptional regulator [Georgenia faecalis]|uniref:NmrA family transcriptional regulator n=1 Tax=Georgenia faecalis TaxID=2483799 RepID=A0ABV9D9C5_9MICO|nr:NmrA family transcriptional regulator [Georgenia faecalis]
MTTHTQEKTTLVLGGTGKTGRRVRTRLDALGVRTRIGSRAGDPPFDWEDPSTWPAVLDGIGAAYLCYVPDLAVPGAGETVGALADAAVVAGVRRLVLLSGRGEPAAQEAEDRVRAAAAGSPTTVTVVRASWFAQNFSESFLLDGVLRGEVALPVGAVGEPFIDAEDIADVVTTALTEDRHDGALYEVTGPRLLTFAEAAEEVGRAIGRPVRYRTVTVDEYARAMAEQGIDEGTVDFMTYLFTEVLDGHNASVTDGVRRAVGHPARDFADYARRTAAEGAWSAAYDEARR